MVTRIGPKHPTHLYLREYRDDRGLTQEQLAERIGTTKATISRIENGRRDPTLGFLGAAVEALGRGLVVSDLFSPPEQPSVDAKLRTASQRVREQVYVVVEALLKTVNQK
jgi:transcriptional regulator with XRE-family HTH domain